VLELTKIGALRSRPRGPEHCRTTPLTIGDSVGFTLKILPVATGRAPDNRATGTGRPLAVANSPPPPIDPR